MKKVMSNIEKEKLIAFKESWRIFLKDNTDWLANPQKGLRNEFFYYPKNNLYNLRIWHHPLKKYLSVQNLEKQLDLNKAKLEATLPQGFTLKHHPKKSLYLDAPTPLIDMSAAFADEIENIKESMKIAQQALDLVEAAIPKHSSPK